MKRFLPFKLRIFPFLFNLFSKTVNWIMLQKFRKVLHYLDDIFSISASLEEVNEFGCVFDQVCEKFDISVNHTKDITGFVLEFLIIKLDTICMETCLSDNKLQNVKNHVITTIQKISLS